MPTSEDSPDIILQNLHDKFGVNLKTALSQNGSLLKEVELKARALQLANKALLSIATQEHHREMTQICDEIFSDTVISIYLAGCTLDKPAHAALRRALELGVAVIYLWDLPHEYWGWKMHGQDLSFSNMLTHLDRSDYRSMLSKINPTTPTWTVATTEAKRLYRILSDTVHGKPSTLELTSPTRFEFASADWETHLTHTRDVENLLIASYCGRFPNITEELNKQLPQLQRISN
jgi:hypothetical protein